MLTSLMLLSSTTVDDEDIWCCSSLQGVGQEGENVFPTQSIPAKQISGTLRLLPKVSVALWAPHQTVTLEGKEMSVINVSGIEKLTIKGGSVFMLTIVSCHICGRKWSLYFHCQLSKVNYS